MKKISEEIREYDEWLNGKYAERKDKDNALPVGITNTEFCEWAMRILLGDGWYVATPVGNDQINEVALEEIIVRKCGMKAKDRKENKKKMNKTINLEIAKSEIKLKTRTDILEEKVAKLEKAVFVEPTEACGPADEEARIIINGNIDRKLYVEVCTLCLSEDDVNVIYEKGGKEKARACFQNETKGKAK